MVPLKEARIVRFDGYLHCRGGLVLNDRNSTTEVTNPRASIDPAPEDYAP